MPAPPRAPQRGGRRRTVLAACLAVLLIAALGGGGWLLWGPDGEAGGPRPGKAEPVAGAGTGGVRETVEQQPAHTRGALLYKIGSPRLGKGEVSQSPGTWATERTFAKTLDREVVGHRADSGKQVWRIPLPGVVCAAARHVTDDGLTAVVFEPGQRQNKQLQPCNQLAVFDVDSGKKVWQKAIPGADDVAYFTAGVAISHGVVAAGWINGSAGFSVDTGKLLWKSNPASECRDRGFAGGRGLVSVVACGDSANPLLRVQRVDPLTGEPKWTYKAAAGVGAVFVVSTDPVVIAVAAGGSDATTETDLISIDERGTMRAMVPLQDGLYETKCRSLVESCKTPVVSGDTLFLPSRENEFTDGPDTASNEIVAFDLRTGKARARFPSKAYRVMQPLRMSGKKLLAYREGLGEVPAEVVSIDPATGKQQVLLTAPALEELQPVMGRPHAMEIVYEHGRLYFGSPEVFGPDDFGGNLHKIPIAIAFGAR
ncbi:outer membrane protein assembly factor BamB family protein [Streptomyces sp. SYSU K21746]